ncbi:MAG: hypothetical protein HOO87_03080 [Methyloglobulus sp.]|nr:hypothetical protein [Methyloglobulus sp.]
MTNENSVVGFLTEESRIQVKNRGVGGYPSVPDEFRPSRRQNDNLETLLCSP